MIYELDFSEQSLIDLKKHKKIGNVSNLKRITRILEELTETPFEGIKNPEQLKQQFEEVWSRKINKKDRFVYEILHDEITIIVHQSLGHINDK